MTGKHWFAIATSQLARSVLFLGFLLSAVSIQALGQAPEGRQAGPSLQPNLVVSEVNAHKAVPLAGHLPGWARGALDAGRAAPETYLKGLTLLLARSPEREAAFHQLLDDQQDPQSPRYHQWLTPAQIGERYGVNDHDLAAVTEWLKSQGLQVDRVSSSRSFITFSGSAAAVGAALSTEFHAFRVKSALHSTEVQPRKLLSIASKPAVPAALAPVIRGFSGLSQIPVQPYARMGVASRSDFPDLTGCTAAGDCQHFVVPKDFANIFDVGQFVIPKARGQRVAILGRSRVEDTDIQQFGRETGTGGPDVNVLVPPDGLEPGITNDGDQGEATLDVTRVLGTAPIANIDLLVSADSETQSGVFTTALYEVDVVLDPVATISFGACEANAGASGVAAWDQLASQGAAEGISIFVSSGDAGAAGCDENFATPPATQVRSQNYICSSSYLTCVGGTQFNDTVNPSQYWAATNEYGTLGSALGYIPEGGWNEPTGTDKNGLPIYKAASSGGGASAFISKPSWQSGPGVPDDGLRDTPDVAFPSSAHDGYFACLAAVGGDCSKGYFIYFAGTSAAAPSMAAIAAIADGAVGSPQGNFNPALYRLAADPSNQVFHDTTVESSGVTGCDIATPSLCNNSTPSPTALTGGLAGYAVGTGYDQVTGLGSIDVANFVDVLTSSSLPIPTVVITLSHYDVTTLQPVDINVTVSGNGSTPTGSVALSNGSPIPPAPIDLTDGKASFPAQSFPIPSPETVYVRYLGDTNYQPATSNVETVFVSPAPGSIIPKVTMTASDRSIAAGQAVTITASVAGSGATPTGTFQFYYDLGVLGPPVPLMNGVATLETQQFLFPKEDYAVQGVYSGDGSYQGNYAVGIPLTVTPQLFASFAVAGANVTIGSPGTTTGNTSAVTVTGQNGFSGSVTFTCTVAYQGTGTVNHPPVCGLSNNGTVVLSPDAPSGTLTATFTTVAPSGSGAIGQMSALRWWAGGVALAGLLLPLGWGRRLRRGWVFGLFLFLSLGLGALSGCGGGSSAPTPPPVVVPGTTAGNYTVTLTGTSGRLLVTTNFTLVVQ